MNRNVAKSVCSHVGVDNYSRAGIPQETDRVPIEERENYVSKWLFNVLVLGCEMAHFENQGRGWRGEGYRGMGKAGGKTSCTNWMLYT